MNAEKRDFNKAAASWDSGPRAKLADDIARTIRDEISLTRDMDIMDFGCGTGLLAMNLQPYVGTVTGVDSSPGMLEVFEAKIKALDSTKVSARHLDLEKGDRLEGSYHLVTSSMTLHHVSETRPLLDQFYRILTPGGHLVIADLDSDDGQFHEDSTGVFHNGFDRSKLRQAFEKAGFEEVSDRTAATMTKPVAGGGKREFTIFLISGRKKK